MLQSKRLIYVILAILLGSSLINSPVKVMAADSADYSSTPITTTVATANQKQASNQKTVTPVQSTNQVPVAASAEPSGTPSNADKISNDGWSFLLTILKKGFSSQPQPETYIARQNVGSAKISGMSILTSLGNGFGVPIYVRRWHWDASQNNWIEDKNQTNGSTGWSLIWGNLGFLDVQDYSLSNLDVGTYYYQFHYIDGRDGIFIKAPRYYSRLAKVVVTPEPVPASFINASTDNSDGTPKVIYPDINYDVSAMVIPTNSTDNVSWQASSTDDVLKFTPPTGRKTVIKAGNGDVGSDSQYKPDQYYTQKVNKNPNIPGIPAKFKVAAGNVSKTKTVYVGGLPAYKKAMDAGGTWSVSGLADLMTATGSTSSWHYEWKFTDSTGTKVITPSTGSGVTNFKGDITNLANLNTEQPLTFTKDSPFIKNAAAATAAGKSYQAQLTLTTNITEESSGSSKEVTIVSNKAALQAQPANGKLSLDQVPSFRFGNVLSKDIYVGTTAQGKQYQVSDGLKITDTRVTPGWQLTAKMSKMTSATGKQLSSTAINITGLPTNLSLADNDTEKTIMTDKVSKTWQVTGKLALSANPNIQLVSGDRFSSNITWTLNSAQPVAPTA
ncbi:hypothetical protein GKC31_10150 (plasmid) [Lactobacillus curvatus]|nr:hypothetical protein [Latilactobacillus curvatus]MSD84821.1 hypothetical protein [Latilactobacillus curvatus]